MLAALVVLPMLVPAGGVETITIHPESVTIRQWDGFGCSLSWWSVFTEHWPEQAQREVCRRLFGRAPDCLGLNVVRYNAGGTSPDADPIRFRPGGRVQVLLDRDGTFHPERDRGQIACLRQARRCGASVFELFVNSPPYWMLRNGDTHGGDNGGENLKPECEQEYAHWLVRVAADLQKAAGVRFTSLEPFNEPSAWWWRADKDGQEGCRMLPETQARVLRALRRELDRQGSRCTIACSDENDALTALSTLEWLTDPSRGALDQRTIGRVNVHSYSGWESQDRLREACQRLGIGSVWMSEVSHREWDNAGYVPNDMRCALPQTRAIASDLARLRPSAWVYWQAVEPLQYCVWYRFTYGLIQAAADTPMEWQGRTYQPGEFIISKAFYAMMQYSRFLRPGYRFVETSDFWTVAALSPTRDRLVIVVHHDGKEPRTVSFDPMALAMKVLSVEGWRTMDDSNGTAWNCRPFKVLWTRQAGLQDTIPPRSVSTYVVRLAR